VSKEKHHVYDALKCVIKKKEDEQFIRKSSMRDNTSLIARVIDMCSKNENEHYAGKFFFSFVLK
jgi:hypothetical protein